MFVEYFVCQLETLKYNIFFITPTIYDTFTALHKFRKLYKKSHELSSIGGHLHYYAGDRGSNPDHPTYSP
jgi:hypothetical protein